MTKIRCMMMACLYSVLVLFLSGCKLAILDPKGIIAADEKNILIVSVLLMLVVVIPVIILTLVFAWRYREGNTTAKYSPNWAHSTLIEVVCWSVPCVIIVILSFITWVSSHRLDPYKPLETKEDHLVIQAIALEWKWLFIYPDHQIATINHVQFPVGVPVKFIISSEGPMNSFQIPQLAGQIYAMAGMKTQLHLLANTPGDYRGISANYSGRGFSDMKFTARASTPEAFHEWVKSVKQSRTLLTMAEYNKLMQPSINHAVQHFTLSDQDVFETAVMKSMMPMDDNNTLHKKELLASH